MSLEIKVKEIVIANKKVPLTGVSKTLKIDNKRRVTIPSKLREKLSKRRYIIGEKEIQLYGVKITNGEICHLSVYDHYPVGFKPYEIEDIRIDSYGRMNIPHNLPWLGGDEVYFIGRFDYVDLMRKEDWGN